MYTAYTLLISTETLTRDQENRTVELAFTKAYAEQLGATGDYCTRRCFSR